jgi:hypothetical protein
LFQCKTTKQWIQASKTKIDLVIVKSQNCWVNEENEKEMEDEQNGKSSKPLDWLHTP